MNNIKNPRAQWNDALNNSQSGTDQNLAKLSIRTTLEDENPIHESKSFWIDASNILNEKSQFSKLIKAIIGRDRFKKVSNNVRMNSEKFSKQDLTLEEISRCASAIRDTESNQIVEVALEVFERIPSLVRLAASNEQLSHEAQKRIFDNDFLQKGSFRVAFISGLSSNNNMSPHSAEIILKLSDPSFLKGRLNRLGETTFIYERTIRRVSDLSWLPNDPDNGFAKIASRMSLEESAIEWFDNEERPKPDFKAISISGVRDPSVLTAIAEKILTFNEKTTVDAILRNPATPVDMLKALLNKPSLSADSFSIEIAKATILKSEVDQCEREDSTARQQADQALNATNPHGEAQ